MTRSTTTSAVIIFVSDAIGRTTVGSRRQSTRPVSRSNSSADFGGFLNLILTGSPGRSSRTASGEGAVPPPASGAVAESFSGPGRRRRRLDHGRVRRSLDQVMRAEPAAADQQQHHEAEDAPHQRNATRSVWRLTRLLIGERPDREQPEDEPADVGEVRDAAARRTAADVEVARTAPARRNQMPEHEQRRKFEDREEEDDEDHRHDLRAREQQDVAAEHAPRSRRRRRASGPSSSGRSTTCSASAATPPSR